MSEKAVSELFSLQRTTRQNKDDMLREMLSFMEYWAALNDGNSKVPVKARDYKNWNERRYSYDTIRRFYGSWEAACEIVKLNVWKVDKYDDGVIIKLFLDLWRWRGQRPVISDLQKYNREKGTKLDSATIAKRWGSWTEFVKLISQLGNGQITFQDVLASKVTQNKREPITPRLRSEVLQRDNYSCVDCGASPRDNSSVKLHIHHTLPVSKGGKSSIDNLVTNCSVCNLGKSDQILSG